MPPTHVVNTIHGTRYDVYIGRNSFYGNPYTHRYSSVRHVLRVATVEEALRLYREWLTSSLEILAWPKPTPPQIAGLRGKVLGCFCRPPEGFLGRVLCHGQILAGLADDVRPEDVP